MTLAAPSSPVHGPSLVVRELGVSKVPDETIKKILDAKKESIAKIHKQIEILATYGKSISAGIPKFAEYFDKVYKDTLESELRLALTAFEVKPE